VESTVEGADLNIPSEDGSPQCTHSGTPVKSAVQFSVRAMSYNEFEVSSLYRCS
jgi:hypothetical protein